MKWLDCNVLTRWASGGSADFYPFSAFPLYRTDAYQMHRFGFFCLAVWTRARRPWNGCKGDKQPPIITLPVWSGNVSEMHLLDAMGKHWKGKKSADPPLVERVGTLQSSHFTPINSIQSLQSNHWASKHRPQDKVCNQKRSMGEPFCPLTPLTPR